VLRGQTDPRATRNLTPITRKELRLGIIDDFDGTMR
jgi:hypothetical protein